MKKLIPMIAAAVGALSAFAVGTTGEKFEDATLKAGYWETNDTEIAFVATNGAYNVLKIEDSSTTSPVKRYYNGLVGEETTHAAQEIPATGLYFDSMVKFTLSSDLESLSQLPDDAKIAFCAYTNEEDTAAAKLVVRGAYYDGSTLVPTNYITTAEVADGVWYRVTAKAIKTTTDGDYGFAIYLNENLVACDDYDIGEPSNLTSLGSKYKTAKALFPSLRGNEYLDANKLTEVDFAGVGELYDLDFNDTVPSFAKDDFVITITKDDGVDSVTVDGKALTFVEGSAEVTNAAETTSVNIQAKAKTGYAFDGWENGDKAVEQGSTFDIATFEVQFTVDGVPYKEIGDAVDAAIESGKTLQLVKDLTGLDGISSSAESGTLTIDLNGKSMTANADTETLIEFADGNLVITNSADTIGVLSTEAVAEEESASLLIASTTSVYGAKVCGAIEGDPVTCSKGFYKDADYAEFPYEVAEGYEAVGPTEGYWEVKAIEPVVIKPFAIIISASETNTYETLDEAIAAAENDDTITVLQDATLVATATINKPITLDLNEKVLTLPVARVDGVKVTAAATIQNGTLQSQLASYAETPRAYALHSYKTSAVYSNLVVNAANYRFAVYAEGADEVADCYGANDPTTTVDCYNVDVKGNSTLFEVEFTKMNLDAECSAILDGTAQGSYQAAIYSAGNATVTVAGGEYSNTLSLLSGNLGGKIVVNGGEFTGNIKSWMDTTAYHYSTYKDDPKYKAYFTLNAGTYNGNIIFQDESDAARALDVFTKGATVELAAPAGYTWDNNTLRKLIAVTSVAIDQDAVTVKAGATTNLIATVTPDNADVTNTVWTSSDTAIATVDQKGVVTAVAAGEATITVTVMAKIGEDQSDTCTVTVEESTVYPSDMPEGSKKAYDTWKGKYPGVEIDPEAATTKEAFLLDCAPTAEAIATAKANFKVTSIEYDSDSGKWIVKVTGDVGDGEAYGNGVVNVKSVKDTLFPEAGEDCDFFQATLDYVPANE